MNSNPLLVLCIIIFAYSLPVSLYSHATQRMKTHHADLLSSELELRASRLPNPRAPTWSPPLNFVG